MNDIATGVADRLAGWAAEHPQIRRVWLLTGRARGKARGNGAIDVALELAPVGDSEETLSIWMARSDSWRAQLANRLPCAVKLEWIDADGSTRAPRVREGETRALVYERSG